MLPCLLYLVLLTAFLPACDKVNEKVLYPRIEPSMWSSYFQLQEIKPGMTRQEVIARMGQPRVSKRGENLVRAFYSIRPITWIPKAAKPCEAV